MCEVNYSIQKKKSENSKYSLINNEQDSPLFIFEIISVVEELKKRKRPLRFKEKS